MRAMLLVSLLACGIEIEALAADLLAPGALEASSIGGVSAAGTSGDGQARASFHLRSLDHSSALTQGLGNGGGALKNAQVSSAIFSLGMAKNFDFSLGLHSAYESAELPKQGDFLSPQSVIQDVGWQPGIRRGGFSGVSFYGKLQLLEGSAWALASAGFMELGAGERALDSMTRSVGGKAGFLVIYSLKAAEALHWSFNVGMRYREPEAYGRMTMRQEAFAKSLIEGILSEEFRVFTVTEARNLYYDLKSPGEAVDKKSLLEGAFQGGVKLAFDTFQIDLFYGKSFKTSQRLAYGNDIAGIDLSVVLGNLNGRVEPKTSYAKQIEKERELKTKDAPVVKKKTFVDEVSEVFPPQSDYAEMQIEPSDDAIEKIVSGINGENDLIKAEKEVKAHLLTEGEISDDEKVNRELEAVKDAEKLAEEKRQEEEIRIQEEERKKRLKEQKEYQKLFKSWEDDAAAEVDSVPGIEKDQLDWSGLED